MRVPLLFLGFQRLFEFEFDVFFFSCCCVFFLGEIPPVEWEKCDAIFYGHFRFAFIGQQHTHTHTNDKTFLKWNEIRQFEQI